MLEPRESDLPALFLFFVVFPVVTYILLGKWSEAAKRKERINFLAQLATEEALKAEAMAAASVVPITSSLKNGTYECASSFKNVTHESVVSSLKNATHECAQCFRPATTRCSRCKSVRYCSGRCQIIHWRQGHKQECWEAETSCLSLSPKPVSVEESTQESAFRPEDMNSHSIRHKMKQPVQNVAAFDNEVYSSVAGACGASSTSDDTSGEAMLEKKTTEKRLSRKTNREVRRENGLVIDSLEESSGNNSLTSPNITPSKGSRIRHKLRNNNCTVSEGDFKGHIVNGAAEPNGLQTASRNSVQGSHILKGQCESVSELKSSEISSLSCSGKKGNCSSEIDVNFVLGGGNLNNEAVMPNGQTVQLDHPAEVASSNKSVKPKGSSNLPEAKFSKSGRSMMKVSREQLCSEMEAKRHLAEGNTMKNSVAVPGQGNNGVTSLGIMKIMGLKKSKSSRQDASDITRDKQGKIKMLFPYEEFVKLFYGEVCDLSPRGLSNCGNSCYANAVLQCLTFTRPLAIYLLQRSHSRACCVRNWCLMCELEQHVTLLRESRGTISPSRILSHMRINNCQIGDGSQEDAHEFLRLLVTSMQFICLERLGGEQEVDPRLQETTFIQHTFGGRLRSKVKCLRCQHESERFENIMDLTLEILGWVESLEDALTQFTTPEDLDGENMYRCGRCAAYVQARKQLSIHEAPNVLTIVLKRFQEGRYGKINKCITFPDLLDMVPFMTGADDVPPLYILYAVVVHLDTQNASFSGHYVAYVKDLQGNWFRIDDAEVQPVPMCHVMSEGAYILFYMRSSPRPPRTLNGKPTRQPDPASMRHSNSKTQKSSRSRQSKASNHFPMAEPSTAHRQETIRGFNQQSSEGIFRTASASKNVLPPVDTYTEGSSMEYSDAASSDWSLFTSSDDASFTTESSRGSFSTLDYSDNAGTDPISSIFNPFYAPEYSTQHSVSCRMFPNRRKDQTRFVSEEKGYVLDSHLSRQLHDRVHRGEYPKHSSVPPTEFASNKTCSMYVKYGSNPTDGLVRTPCNCEL